MAIFANNFRQGLATAITASDTTIEVVDISVFDDYCAFYGQFPSNSNPAYLTIDDGTNVEVVAATGYNSTANTFTVVRNSDFTDASAPFEFDAGTLVELRLPAVVLGQYIASSVSDAFIVNSSYLSSVDTEGSVAIEGSLQGRRTVTLGSRADEECAHVGWRSETVNSDRTVSMGYTAKATSNEGIAIGHSANTGTTAAIGIGTEVEVNVGIQSVAIGYRAGSGLNETITSGGNVYVGAYSSANSFAVAVGRQSNASAESVAVGTDAGAEQNGVALGYQSVAGERAISINASWTVDDAVGIGAPAYTSFLSNEKAPSGVDRIGVIDNDTLAMSSASQTTVLTTPVSIGDDTAFNAATAYKAGDVVVEGSYDYYLAQNADYLKVTGSGATFVLDQTTPTWSVAEHPHTADSTWVRSGLHLASTTAVDLSLPAGFVVEEVGIYFLNTASLSTTPASIDVGTVSSPSLIVSGWTVSTATENVVLTQAVSQKLRMQDIRFSITTGSGATAYARMFVKGFYLGDK